MSQYTSYYLYQRYESIGNQPAVPSYPAIYSIDGDGTRQLVIRKENDEDCGYDSGGTTPQYRWVTDGTICIGYDKYSRQTKQVSYDSGVTWNNVYPTETQAGSLIEANSSDCGAATIYKWEVMDSSTNYICDGTSKYYKEQKYVSYDNGSTWQGLDEYRKGELIQLNSPDCGGSASEYATQYLTIESLEDGNVISFYTDSSDAQMRISVSTDDGQTWNSYKSTDNTGRTIATLDAGEKILIRGTNKTYSTYTSNIFRTKKKFNVYGNIMSLISGDSFVNADTLPNYSLPAGSAPRTFANMFSGCTKLISAENLVLPATTLRSQCYLGMFYGCTSLETAPELPATRLEIGCYAQMFYGCTSLETAPELPATTLANQCYYYMFNGCTSLLTAPSILPAITLAQSCYDSMFNGCTSLTTAPTLPATTLAYERCYLGMFYGCTSLNSITCLATDISAFDCTYNWLSGVSATGTFTKAASMTDWTSGVSGIPSGWTVQNA